MKASGVAPAWIRIGQSEPRAHASAVVMPGLGAPAPNRAAWRTVNSGRIQRLNRKNIALLPLTLLV